MSHTPDEVAAAILATLSTTAPGLSCELGTPERKIIDACAEAISEAYIDQYIVGSLLDIDTKSGLELDQFCLVPGTLVITPHGPVEIETIESGQDVITHTGRRGRVLATSCRDVDEDVVTLRTAVGVEQTMTMNHPVLVTKKSWLTMLASQIGNWRRDGSKNKEHAFRLRGLGNKTVWDSRNLKRDWVSAGSVEPGDIVWGTEPAPAGTAHSMSDSEKRLVGWYLAEGHVTLAKRGIGNLGFSFHEDEVEYQQEVDSLLRSEWGVRHTRIAKSGLGRSKQVNCYDGKLAREIAQRYGKGAANKHIDWETFDSDEDLTPLIAAYWRGDGTAAKKQSLRAKTVSPALAHQLFTYLTRMGLTPRLVRDSGGPCNILGRPGIKRDIWTVSIDGESAARLSQAIDYPLRHNNIRNYAAVSVRADGYIGSAITSVRTHRYNGSVHNIEVEGDNSYLLMGNFAVHNCGIFGFGRLQGRQATGVVRVELTSVSTQDFSVALGTQFYTQAGVSGSSTPLYYASTQPVMLVAGTFSTDVPVQCTTVGVAGNVAPNSITYLGSILGASSVTNLVAMTGGVNVETDEELRQRFKDTLLRNIAGTSDWYLDLALQNSNVSKVKVYGPTNLYQTQIAAPSTTATLSVTEDVKYAWPLMESVFINLGQTTETFYTPGDDYTLTSGVSPAFTRVSTGQITTGDIIDLEFQYTTRCSRNDPLNGITNKVDVFADGVDPFTITEKTVVASTTLSASSASPLYTGNFQRVGSSGTPSSSNRFMRLASCPVVTFPPTITVGPTVYSMGTHYYQLQDITLTQGSKFETSGIEWAASGPANGTELTLNYVYNRVPELLTAVMNTTKQICTDVMVHQADYQFVQPCITVEYNRSYDVATVNSGITTRLQQYFQGLDFGSWVMLSNMCLAVQQVYGVVNVYLTTSGESSTHYGVRIFDNSSDTTPSVIETTDFKFPDNVVAQFLSVVTLRKATP